VWQRRRHQVNLRGGARAGGKTLDIAAVERDFYSRSTMSSASTSCTTSCATCGVTDVPWCGRRYRIARPATKGSTASSARKVIEHIPIRRRDPSPSSRASAPGGLLDLGTPDYATIGWRTIEPLYGFFAPGGYKDEHITHYSVRT